MRPRSHQPRHIVKDLFLQKSAYSRPHHTRLHSLSGFEYVFVLPKAGCVSNQVSRVSYGQEPKLKISMKTSL